MGYLLQDPELSGAIGSPGVSGFLQEIWLFFCAAQLVLQPAWTVRALSGRYYALSHIFLFQRKVGEQQQSLLV